MSKTDAENVEDLMKRVEANDAFSIWEKRENTLTWGLRPLKYHTP